MSSQRGSESSPASRPVSDQSKEDVKAAPTEGERDEMIDEHDEYAEFFGAISPDTRRMHEQVRAEYELWIRTRLRNEQLTTGEVWSMDTFRQHSKPFLEASLLASAGVNAGVLPGVKYLYDRMHSLEWWATRFTPGFDEDRATWKEQTERHIEYVAHVRNIPR